MTAAAPWPEGCASATCFTFDLDGEEVWRVDEEGARRPGVRSLGAYEAAVALPLILELLERHRVTATFFVPGREAERQPAAVESILAAGHEVGHHGHTHRSPASLDPDEEEDELAAGLAALARVGATPTGYRAPNWDLSERSVGLVAAAGLRYSSNLMNDIRPFLHAGTEVIELPVHWLLDDAPYFWFSGDNFERCLRSAAEAGQVIDEERAGLAALGGLAMLTFHPQLIGRPGRLPLLERLIADAVADPTVWVATAGAVAEFARREQDPAPREVVV
ncbi:MAG: polysaccharide deacetylase family protein [Actinobacteria bacterium]|nr:polysaccharide deacetylase family protein [Actinomycetota bacterium]